MKRTTAKRSTFQIFLLLFFFCTCLHSYAQLAADFTIDKTGGCSPLRVSFTNLSSGTTASTKYSWDFGNGNASVLQNPFAIYIDERVYTVTLKLTDGTQTSTKTKTMTVYKKPFVDFNVTKPKVCLPDGAQFNSTSSAGDGTITNYQWDFGDGITQQGFGNSIFHNYSYEITPAVSLTITNSFGCQASITKTNIVEVLPKLEALFTVDKNMLCHLGDSIKLTNNSSGPGTLQYLWNFGDGTTSTLQHPSHRYTQKGIYQVRLTVTNNVGCSVTSSHVTINAANFKTDFSTQNLCKQINFSGTSFIMPSLSQWNFDDGNFSSAYPNTSHTYTSAGNYNVTLINTYNVCKDTITKTITVEDNTAFNTAVTAPVEVCKNSVANFTSTSSATPTNRSWNFGDGVIQNSTSNTISHVYTSPGSYTVTLINTFGTCSETVGKTIIVTDLPLPTGFIADFGGACGAPVTVNFRDTTSGAVAWQWWMDWNFGTPFSTQQNAAYSFSSNGYHTVYLTVTNAAGCKATVSKQVNVLAPAVNIIYTQSSSPKGYYDCDSLTLRFAVNTNQPIRSYSWNLGNGQTSTSPTPQAHYDQLGTYNVVLNYVTENGCTGTASFSPRVYGKPQADFNYNVPCGNSLALNFSNLAPFSDGEKWLFGNGLWYEWMYPSFTFADTGWHNVTMIATIGHCADTITKPVYANLLPSSVSIIKAENTCEGTRGTVTFDQRSVRCSGGTWDFGDGTTIPYDSSNHLVKHTYTATGTYTVRLTSSYKSCSYTSTWVVKILLKQSPVLTANQAQICANNSVNVQVSNLQLNPFAFSLTWDHYSVNKFEYSNGTAFAGSVSTNSFQANTYNGTLQNFAAGTSAIRLIINDSYTGCLDTSNYINLQVNGPIAGFRIANNNSCYKSAFIFIDTSRSATAVALTTWRWEMGDGTIINNTTNASVDHRYANPGNYFVRLTVTDATGCSKTATATVNVRGPKAAFTVSGLYVPNVPLNTTVSFFNNSNSSGTVNYTWHYGDGPTSTTFNGSHTYTVPGTYTVMLIANESSVSCADTAKYVIHVKEFNTAFSFTKSFLGAGSCPPVLVRINNLSVGYTRVLWDFGDGTTSTQAFPSHTYYNNGIYRITLYTYGFNGLTGTYRDSIEVRKPSVQLTADKLFGCTSQQVNLQANTQNAASYLWDFGDGSSATTITVQQHNYLTAGIYNPRLIVKDSLGCAASTQLSDSIIIDSLAIAIKGIPSLVCDSSLINFTPEVESFAASRLGTPLQYKWDFGTGNAADTSAIKNPSFRYTIPGTYVVKFKVVSPYGCVKETTASIVVQQKAKGTIIAGAEGCEKTAITFNGNATSTSGAQWLWNFGNGNTSTQQNPAQQLYHTPGIYTVSLVVTKNGCTDTSLHQLVIHGKPLINASPKEKILCLGDSVMLTANGGGNYLWSPAVSLDNNNIASPIAKPRTSTLYRVQVISDNDCINHDSVNITVAQPVTVSINGDDDICRGLSTQLTASGATSYQWINNITGLNNTAIHNPSASPLSNTTYTVVGSDVYGCFKDTARIIVNVHDLPTVNAGPGIQIQGGVLYQLSATASSDVVSWLWSPANNLSCNNCASPMFTPKMETLYTVKVTNAWGCGAMDTLLVKLNCTIGNVYIPDAFTPNNDGRNDLFYISGTGVKIIRYLRIYDRWGGLLFEKTNFGIDDRSSAWDGKANGQTVASGSYVYLSEMECSSGEKFIRKGTVTVVR